MRVFAFCVALVLCAACGSPTPPSSPGSAGSPGSSPARPEVITPANVMRARSELPAGYEVGALGERVSPLAFWGLGADPVADPPQCGALAQLTSDAGQPQGWSASGPGGIVYAVVVDTAAGLDQAVLGECGHWTVAAGHTSGEVSVVAAPELERATTVGLVSGTTTTVEGGTETHSRAATFNAYLDGHVASVTVVTDPGSAGPALGEDFAATLLGKVVAEVRAG